MSTIAVLGTGYVGLVSGVCLAEKGHQIICVDVNPDIVAKLNRAEPHIYEPGLADLLARNHDAGRFRVTANLAEALQNAEGVIIAVGTPSSNGVIDLTFIKQAAKEIGVFLKSAARYLPVIVKSTVIPGTTDTVVKAAIEAASGKKLGQGFGLGMNPEFLREGNAIDDFMQPDRIVLGHEDAATKAFLETIYAPWDCDKLAVNTRTAEMIKYCNNALLAVQISTVNEFANLAASLGGIDIMDVMRGVHLDKRLNPILANNVRANPEILSYLIPGCGFGGSCFPKDVQALRSQGEQVGQPMAILNAVLTVNDNQPAEVVRILEREVGSDLATRTCLVLGLAFKPDTDDVRETASLKIIQGLLAGNAKVMAHDPIATENFTKLMGADAAKVKFVTDWQATVATADTIIIVTKWPDYRALANLHLTGKIILDPRRLLAADVVPDARYLAVGRRV